MPSTTLRHRVVAALGAVTIGLLGALAVAAPASAAPNIDPNQKATLTIHKFEQPATPTGLPNDGTKLTPAQLSGLRPLSGVGFSIQRVTSVDLSKDAGWKTASTLTAPTVLGNSGAYPLSTAQSGTTNATGDLAFADQAIGLYLVKETNAGSNAVAGAIDPFLVTLPLSTGTNNWLYDVHVYPKNAVTAVDKTVASATGLGLGANLPWTITAKVPYLASGQPLSAFTVTDALDTRLTYVSTSVALSGANALVAGDYTVTAPAVGASGTVTVTFTPQGLTKLRNNQGAIVTVTLVTKVASIGDGTIKNQASVVINGNTLLTPSAESKWGAVKITSTTAGATKEPLSGGTYSIYASAEDAAAKRNPVTVNGQTVFTTGADGTVLVPGVGAGAYWVGEVTPPPGYQANATLPTGTVVAASTANPTVYPFEYSQLPAWMLPLTGSDGGRMFMVAGFALVAIALGAAIVIARRRRSIAAA